MDLQFAHDYDHEKVNKMLMNTEKELGKQEGMIEGKKEASIEIAKSLLKTNMSLDEISKHTTLTIEELKKLKENL